MVIRALRGLGSHPKKALIRRRRGEHNILLDQLDDATNVLHMYGWPTAKPPYAQKREGEYECAKPERFVALDGNCHAIVVCSA
ncbi:hypothetical protein QA635_32010 [Bradyrhizobium brasilense]|uniref:hypothetical protein n=1 Tax=Bradyrhizobium brasilense TaxID=1419277 RepID=UPI0024B1DAEC|nr:hypothetical protein [Bradyrhizobium australafricanum]WFU31159.1 hypothetical protein QA635_32010 [Bradyrhizobium australafricanum]